MLARLSEACSAVGRDPGDLRRSLDIVIGVEGVDANHGFDGPIDAISERILRLGELGIEEVRCYLATGSDPDRIASLQPLVEAVHRG